MRVIEWVIFQGRTGLGVIEVEGLSDPRQCPSEGLNGGEGCLVSPQ